MDKINPLAKFINEHTNLLKYLKDLNNLTYKIEKKGVNSDIIKNLQLALKYLEIEINDHNKLEEEALFPILRKYARKPAELLVQEHKEMKKSFLKTKTSIKKLSVRQNKNLEAELVNNLKNTSQIFVNHIYKENYILFPLIKKFFSTQDIKNISKLINRKLR